MMHRYEEFCRRVRVAQDLVEQGLVDSLAIPPQELAAAIAAVQQTLGDNSDNGTSNDTSHNSAEVWIVAIQVEIDKQLRLLSLDQMFLNTARQTSTLRQRFQQIHGRLDLLASYGQAILQHPPG